MRTTTGIVSALSLFVVFACSHDQDDGARVATALATAQCNVKLFRADSDTCRASHEACRATRDAVACRDAYVACLPAFPASGGGDRGAGEGRGRGRDDGRGGGGGGGAVSYTHLTLPTNREV